MNLQPLLTEFLLANVNGKSSYGVDWFVEFVNVVVDLGLGNFCVVAHNVVIDVTYDDPCIFVNCIYCSVIILKYISENV